MEKDYSYSSQVNRRLASTYFLISSYEQLPKKPLSRSENQAYIDSILLQLYFGCLSYCNELLTHHGKPILKPDSFNLTALFNEKKYEGVSEFNELVALYNQKNSGLFQLCKAFEDLSSIGSKEEQEEDRKRRETQTTNANSSLESSVQKINLITIDTVNLDTVTSGVDLSDVKVIKDLLINLQELIDRQREYLLEY